MADPELSARAGRWYGTARHRKTEERILLIVTRKDHEDAEQLLRRFNKMVQRDGILQEARRRRHFISNREKARQAERRAARRRRRAMMKARRRI